MEEPGWRRYSLGGIESAPPSPGCFCHSHQPPHHHHHIHTHTLIHTLWCPKANPWGTHLLLFGIPQGPALRQQHGHHDLCRSLSVLSFIGSSYCPPLPLLSTPTSAFSIPLDIKFGGFFCIFESVLLSPAPPCHPSPQCPHMEIMHLCLL